MRGPEGKHTLSSGLCCEPQTGLAQGSMRQDQTSQGSRERLVSPDPGVIREISPSMWGRRDFCVAPTLTPRRVLALYVSFSSLQKGQLTFSLLLCLLIFFSLFHKRIYIHFLASKFLGGPFLYLQFLNLHFLQHSIPSLRGWNKGVD